MSHIQLAIILNMIGLIVLPAFIVRIITDEKDDPGDAFIAGCAIFAVLLLVSWAGWLIFIGAHFLGKVW